MQFRRWLAVEDSHYDEGRVTVNGRQAWINFTQNIGEARSTDGGLHLGGWQVEGAATPMRPK